MTATQFSTTDIAAIHGSSSDMVLDNIETAANHASPVEIEWADGHGAYITGGIEWYAFGHAFIDGEPHDATAYYAIDNSGNVTAARVTILPATI